MVSITQSRLVGRKMVTHQIILVTILTRHATPNKVVVVAAYPVEVLLPTMLLLRSTIKDLQIVMPNLSDKQYEDIFYVLNFKNDGPPVENDGPQAHHAAASTAPSGLSPLVPGRWIIDSGATYHITRSPYLLTNPIKNISLPPVSLPSGEKASITSIGNIQLSDLLQLKDVLRVPSFQVDLLSVGKVTDGLHCSVTFFPSWCILQDLISKVTIGVGKRRGNLYYLVALASTSSRQNQPSCHHITVFADLWHRHLGHPSLGRLQYLANKTLHFPFDSSHSCHICPLAKQTRQPFSRSSISTSKCFELLHCDIWGPHKTASLSGAHYFLTIVDDFSRFTWVFLMRHKHETQSALKTFFAYVATQFQTQNSTN